VSARIPQLAAQHYVIGQPYRNEESYDSTKHRPHVRMWVVGERPCHMTPDEARALAQCLIDEAAYADEGGYRPDYEAAERAALRTAPAGEAKP
jgi:hypothetical protein